MSDIFGTPRPRREPRRGPDRRQRVLVPTLITLALLLFLGSIFTSVWTDRLWFKSVGYGDVFRSVLFTRVALFVVLGLIFGLFVIGNLYVAYRTRPDAAPMRRDDPAYRYRLALTPLLRPLAIGFGLVLTGFAGSVAAAHWDTYKMWRNGTSFGTKDAAVRQGRQLLRLRLPVVALPDVVLVRADRHHGARRAVPQLRLRRHPHRRAAGPS